MSACKIAIVGSGASAVGVLSGIKSSGIDADIYVFSSEKYFGFSPEERYSGTDTEQSYKEVYAAIKRQAVNYPPRKTFYGDSIPCYIINNKERFFISDMFGGQTNIWGGFVLPFRENDFDGWPITRKELEPHYQAVAKLIGIAGRHDRASDFLTLDYSTSPPVKQLDGFEYLEQYINGHAETDDYRFHAGVSRVAVDTRDKSPSSCTYCGECMAGCLRDSIYSARHTLKKYIEQDIIKFVRKNIKAIRLRDINPELITYDDNTEAFDRVFLCAGCASTTEILMRSLHINTGPVLQDNVIYQFPIINLSGHSDRQKEQYFGLTNLLLLAEPKSSRVPFLQAQFYPNADYLWRTLVPRWSWKAVRHPVRKLRDRIIWARLYMDAEDSYMYNVKLVDDRLSFEHRNIPDRKSLATFMDNFRQALRGSMYYVLPLRPVLAHTSAHLSSTFPYGGSIVNVARDGEAMSHVHIADSTCFPGSPVISPTLTIMANARRTALEALQ